MTREKNYDRVSEVIGRFVNDLSEGELFAAFDLRRLGKANTVDQALHRCYRRGEIQRLARGVWIKSQESHPLVPAIDVARVKARAYGKWIDGVSDVLATTVEASEENPVAELRVPAAGCPTSFMYRDIRIKFIWNTQHADYLLRRSLGAGNPVMSFDPNEFDGDPEDDDDEEDPGWAAWRVQVAEEEAERVAEQEMLNGMTEEEREEYYRVKDMNAYSRNQS